MKKIRNLLLIMTFTLCVSILPNYVKASPEAKNFKIYCPSDSITLGETANCYLLAQITEENEKGIDSVYTSIGGLGKLTIANAFAYEPNDVNVTKITGNESASFNYECTEFQECYNFKAADGKTIRNLGTSKINSEELSKIEWQGYSVIGYWTLKFADDAVAGDYGRLCLDVSYISSFDDNTGSSLGKEKDIGCNDTIKAVAANPTCEIKNDKYYGPSGTEVTQDEYEKQCELTIAPSPCIVKSGKYYGTGGNEVTEEEYQKQCSSITPPNTGSFASYLVLASGAFIALSTITIAKKYNKFYKV